MKVYLAGTSLEPAYGGPAYSVSRLAQALAAEGAEVGLWAPDQSATTTELLPPSGPVRRLGGDAGQAWRTFGGAPILHDNGIWLPHNHALANLAARAGAARVVSTRGMLEPWAVRHKRWKKAAAWIAYQRRDLAGASLHHATGEVEARNLQALRLDVPVRTIPNGVDVPAAQPRASRSGRIRTALFLGRIYPVKGLPMLIEAWSRIRPGGWRLQIAGPDEAGHKGEVERAIAREGLGDVIAFMGALGGPAKAAALREADLLVLPSHSESFGMAVAEALAYGLPVLATSAVPWPGLEEQRCGWRVAPTTDGLAEGLRAAAACDARTLRAMGERGRAYVAAEFGWPQVAQRFLAAYAQARQRPAG